jgi:4-diphosphocytidyl-2-C-methyl-D-erythritol kinase
VGSDVPFLLEAGLATGSGRGEVLTRIPFRTLHMVLIAPKVEVPDKTREMYARVQAADYSSGRRIIALEKLLGGGAFDIPAELLHNGLRRPLYDLVPEVRMLALAVESITGRPAHITGAGPAHFVLCRNMADALDTRHRIAGAIQPSVASLTAVRSVPHVLTSDSIDG